MAPSTASSSSGSNKKAKVQAPSRSELAASPYASHAHSLAKLLANPLRPVHIPAPPAGGVKQLRAPREMMKNVQGSSAGAGSGEFHVYRAGRRREYERLKLMDEQELLDQTVLDTAARALEYETTAESKTAKNRLKRQRQKNNARGKGSASTNLGTAPIDDVDVGRDEGEKKRKIGSGAGVKFTRVEDREDGDDDDEQNDGDDVTSASNGQDVSRNELVTLQAEPAIEAGIMIRDED